MTQYDDLYELPEIKALIACRRFKTNQDIIDGLLVGQQYYIVVTHDTEPHHVSPQGEFLRIENGIAFFNGFIIGAMGERQHYIGDMQNDPGKAIFYSLEEAESYLYFAKQTYAACKQWQHIAKNKLYKYNSFEKELDKNIKRMLNAENNWRYY